MGWHGIFEPLAPSSSISHFPLKFLAGVTVQPLNFPEGTIIVSVDSNKVTIPSSVKLPPLPKREELEKALGARIKELRTAAKDKRIDPYKAVVDHQIHAKEYMDIITAFLTDLKQSAFLPGKSYDTVTKHRDKVSLPLIAEMIRDLFMRLYRWPVLYQRQRRSSIKLS